VIYLYLLNKPIAKDDDNMTLTNEDLKAISDLIQPIKDGLQDVKHKLTAVELHLENGTDKNIQLIAENFIEFV